MNTTNPVEMFKAAVDGLLWMSESDYPFEVSTCPADGAVTPEPLLPLGDRPADTPVVKQSVAEFFAPVLARLQGMEPVAERSLESPILASPDPSLAETTSPDPTATPAEPASPDQRLLALMELINSTLTDAIVYRVGEVEIDIYIMGRVSPEEWLILSTRAIET